MSEFVSKNEVHVFPGSQAEEVIAKLKIGRNQGSPVARKLLKMVGEWFSNVIKETESDVCFEHYDEHRSHRMSLVRYRGVYGSFYYLYDRILKRVYLLSVEFVHLVLDGKRLFSLLGSTSGKNSPGSSPKGGRSRMSSAIALVGGSGGGQFSGVDISFFNGSVLAVLNDRGPEQGKKAALELMKPVDNYVLQPELVVGPPFETRGTCLHSVSPRRYGAQPSVGVTSDRVFSYDEQNPEVAVNPARLGYDLKSVIGDGACNVCFIGDAEVVENVFNLGCKANAIGEIA